MADWKAMYGDGAERIKKMQNMLQFLGVEFTAGPNLGQSRPLLPPQILLLRSSERAAKL